MSYTEADYANMQNSTNQGVKVVAGVGGGILLPAIIVAFVRLLSGVKLAALQVGYISFDFLMAATILAIAMAADIECDQFKADLIRASIILHFIFFFASNGCSIWKMSCKCSDWFVRTEGHVSAVACWRFLIASDRWSWHIFYSGLLQL